MSAKTRSLASQWMKAASAGVLLLSIALSFVWYQVSLQNLKTRLTIRFENDAGEFAYLIAKRIELYSNFLYSAKGLFTASDKIERDEWAAFIHSNDLKSRYPGIQALRYIERVTAAEKENYIARVKADTSLIPAGYPDFQIVPERVMEEYYVVTYVQPYSGNEFMLGYDLSSEASRNKSMKAAADLDEPRATNAVTLLRDTDKGIILFMPVYRKGNVVMDVEARRKNLQGFVDVVIRINDLLKNIYQSGEFSSRFDFKIYDGSDPAASEIIYSSGEPRSPQRGNLSYTTRIDLAGQVWTLVFGSEYERRATSAELFYPKILFAGGTCAGFLLAGLLYVFARTNTRALEIAGRMTESMNLEMQERRKADEKLRELFQQLEIKNQQAQLTRGLADLLQSCSRMQEAFSILASFAEKLFPGTKGELYLINESRNFLETAAGWGGYEAAEQIIMMDACWGLRRGRVHYAAPGSAQPRCDHDKEDNEARAVCVPLMVQGEALGIFHMRFGAEAPLEELMLTFCDQASLALGNLKLRETLKNQSIRDQLTGIFNRRFMEETLSREINQCARMKEPLSIFMFDVDHFKKCNDEFGHEMGDYILSSIGQFITKKLRRYDTPCRYGGEEFLVIMPGASNEHALEKAEQIRREISELKMGAAQGKQTSVTLSFGVASYPAHGDTPEDLVRSADEALYAAKAGGRNRVVLAADKDKEQDKFREPEK